MAWPPLYIVEPVPSSELYPIIDYAKLDTQDPEIVRALGIDRDSLNQSHQDALASYESGCQGLIVSQHDKQVVLSYTPTPSLQTSRPSSPAEERRSASPVPEVDVSADTSGTMATRRREWILVLHFKIAYGTLRLPDFANQIIVSLPLCLKNFFMMRIDPPAPSSSSGTAPLWDLLVEPSLRSSTMATQGESTVVKGSFAATEELSMKWTTRATHALSLRDSKLNVDWTVQASGDATAQVKGESQLYYAGLRAKLWLDLLIRHRLSSRQENEDHLQIENLEGKGIVAWELLETREGMVPAIDKAGHSRNSSDMSMRTPKSRHRDSYMPRNRPPSFTNLFDTAPPEPPQLNPEAIAALKEPSLLRQAAPFEGDVSADMTFEANASTSNDAPSGIIHEVPELPPSPEAPDADDDWVRNPHALTDLAETRIRIQIDLTQLMEDAARSLPTFAFDLDMTCSAAMLSASTSLFDITETEGTRYDLPTFSMPAADQEDTTVSVSAPDKVVELMPSATATSGEDEVETSPLPMVNGKARWASQRQRGDSITNGTTEIELSSPTSTSVQLDDLDTEPFSPSYRLSSSSRPFISPLQNLRTASSRSLRSQSSLSSLRPPSSRLQVPPQAIGLVKIKITPVPPQPPQQTWRLFTHLTISQGFVGSFNLPVRAGQDVEVLDTWTSKGETTAVDVVTQTLSDQDKTMHIETPGKERKLQGVNEMLYSVAVEEKDGAVELGDVLPQIGVKVSTMEVEVQPVAGESNPSIDTLNCR
ncbi:hypothetical protein OIO90_000062 [Microbotryomycetes sp. JL221]|nr:hypothetical protein OIO90_000062 [Microbotryomycetes sp. JL221]